jgi:hypothetical protein
MKILILGGYGVFGGRLAHLLSDLPQLELIIAGRSLSKAQAFCTTYQGAPTLTPLQLDRTDIAAHLSTEKPDLTFDASGPFQSYGDDPYRVPRTAIEHAIPYVDFADASDFVAGITALDSAARSADTFALSGVSSFPVLTAAVVRKLAKGLTVKTITGGIAPSPYAGVGLNVMRAVVGYAGHPLSLTRGGEITTAKGLSESLRTTIAPPGALPLYNIHFSLVDVPELQVIPPEYPTLDSIWMGAGPVPESLHRMLNLLAKLRGLKLMPILTPAAPLFYKILNLMTFGEHRGGMFVRITGDSQNGENTRTWNMLAEADDGPLVPSMAIEAVIRKRLNGEVPETGARPATDALTLADYDALFARRNITTGIRETLPLKAPLYERILGTAFHDLPTPMRDLHTPKGVTRWSGTAKVTRGTNPLAKLDAFLFGLPKEAKTTPITVTFTPKNGTEIWELNFGGKKFHSIQSEGTGRNAHLLTERFGPITVSLALVLKNGKMDLVPRRWAFFGIPLPTALLPQGRSYESAQDGAFHFNVQFKTPLTGLIAAYEGRLTKQ